ncbi:MAG: hypothetical protein V1748_06590 [Actinomycetota bacterium]
MSGPRAEGKRRRFTAVAVVLVLALLGGAVAIQYSLDGRTTATAWDKSGPFDTVRSLLDVLGGVRESVAAYFWTKTDTVFHEYLGGSVMKEQALYPYYWLMTRLDPHFVMPYYFASWILCRMGKVDQGYELALEGLRNNPESWELQENLASIYLFFKRDPRKARYHLLQALRLTEDPEEKAVVASFLHIVDLIIAGKRRIPVPGAFAPAERLHEEQHHDEEQH